LPIGFIIDHRYQIRSLIGRGTFCLVWLAFDLVQLHSVAVKVLKEARDGMFEDEYLVNQYLRDSLPPNAKVVAFDRCFHHGPHPCLVFELMGQNILTFLNYFDHAFVTLPRPLVKKIVKDTLEGLRDMHQCGVIHTDLKPENVMASRALFPCLSFEDGLFPFHPLEDDPATIEFKLGDIGNSCFVDRPGNSLIQTRQYRSPEVLLGLPYDTSADIWSLACMTFELSTRTHLFDPLLDESASELSTTKFAVDSLHLSMIEQVIGPIPEDWARQGPGYADLFEEGDLLRRTEEELGSVFDLLVKRGIYEAEAAELADFLEPMLSIIPEQRPSAEEMLMAPWLHQIS
jgi:serine/threonine protein kinase